MYNQNTVKDPVTGRVRGALYTNPIDCLWKTFKAEGIAGWYKGKFTGLQSFEAQQLTNLRDDSSFTENMATYRHYSCG